MNDKTLSRMRRIAPMDADWSVIYPRPSAKSSLSASSFGMFK